MTILASAEARTQLETLASNLFFVSEADSPLKVTQLGEAADLDAPALLAALGKPATSSVERITVDEFFGYAAQEQPFHTAQDRLNVARYQALVKLFSTALEGSRVFRIGSIEIDVYALGKSSDGKWLGVVTKLVET